MDSTLASQLRVVGRMVSVTATAISFSVAAWYAFVLIGYALSDKPGWWGGAGILPLIFLARLAVAGFVAWAVVELDPHTVLRVFLAAFGGFFLLLFGWYFLLIGMDDAIFYLSASADLLYLAGALIIGVALALAGTRRRSRINSRERLEEQGGACCDGEAGLRRRRDSNPRYPVKEV